MKTFADLQFKPHPRDPNGFQARMEFENGYGISVVRFGGFSGFASYTDNDQEWEVAVMKDGRVCYDTPVTDDVIGHLTDEKVTKVMKQIQELPPAK